MFIVPFNQVSPLSSIPTDVLSPEWQDRQAIVYQGRMFIMNEVHQDVQAAVVRCRQFLDNDILAIVVDHENGKTASLWFECKETPSIPSQSKHHNSHQSQVLSLDALVA